jgi:hypothetical protein
MIGFRGLLLVSLLPLSTGCAADHHAASTSPKSKRAELHFVLASRQLRAACRTTSRRVGYAVPCPTRIPSGLAATGGSGPTGCELDIIGAGGLGGCARSWRGWVVGSSTVGEQHLVITASPTALQNEAKLVNGPAWYPRARVRPLGSLTVDGKRMRSIYVPPATNDGSAFSGHVVLIWTARGHTYGMGFHDVDGIRKTLSLDIALARGIVLVQAR